MLEYTSKNHQYERFNIILYFCKEIFYKAIPEHVVEVCLRKFLSDETACP